MIKMKNAMLTAMAFLSFSSYASNEIVLNPTTTIETPTLVTVGIPVKENELSDINNFSLYKENGEEVSVFVKETLSWSIKGEGRNDTRAIKVQFFVDSVNDDNNEYVFNFKRRHTKERLKEQPISDGLMSSKVQGEEGLSYPKVIATLNSEYLRNSGIVAPFYGAKDDLQEVYWNAQFDWSSKLNLNESKLSNWLFDRTTALYKGCMRNNSVECYKEAYVSAQYWMKNIKRDGDIKSCKGGSLIEYTTGVTKPCDTKYLYIEPLKIHMALTGDDESFDLDLVRAMADLSEYNYYYQSKENDPYDNVAESFTERSSGIGLLAQLNAYEITGDVEYLNRVKNRVQILKDHQTSNPDGLPSSGLWRHSFLKHEGNNIDGSGGVIGVDSPDDRTFSPWMTENIIDGLWQSYNIYGFEEIPEMIRYAGEGIVNWGFYDSKGYLDKYGKPLLINGEKLGVNGCNVTQASIIYTASSIANPELLEAKRRWYTDSHNPEMLTILSLGYYFESNKEKKNALKERMDSIANGYLNEKCGSNGKTVRMFNWNNRSNYWGTYLWVLEELGELNQAAGSKPAINDNFSLGYLSDEIWEESNHIWYINNEELEVQSTSILLANNLKLSSNYSLQSKMINTSEKGEFLNLIFAEDDEGNFYSMRVKSGIWGAIYIVKHSISYDYGGKPVFTKYMNIPVIDSHMFKVDVNNSKVVLTVDNESVELDIGVKLYNKKIGYLSLSGTYIKRADDFKIKNN